MTAPNADGLDVPKYPDGDGDHGDQESETHDVDDPGADPKGLTPPRNPFGGGPDQDSGRGTPGESADTGPADKPGEPTDGDDNDKEDADDESDDSADSDAPDNETDATEEE
jgi:hypothetical protein